MRLRHLGQLNRRKRLIEMRLWRVVRTVALTVVVLGATLASAPTAVDAVEIDVDPDGQWGPVEDWPLVGIHTALTSDGNVLTYGTNADGTLTGGYLYDVWTPGPEAAQGHNTQANETGSDLFCNLQLTQAETGQILMFGGDQWTGSGDLANDDINAFDPVTESLTTLPGMNRERWYGSGTTLPDGSFYLQGGTGGFDRPEIWTAERGAELLPFYTFGIDIWYPRNFLLPDGRIFGFDIGGRMYIIPADLSRLDRVGSIFMPPNARGSAAVMFEPGKILEFGGDTTVAYVIDATGETPVVTPTGSLAHERAWVNAVILPDGRVLAIGGADKDAQQNPDDPIESFGVHYEAEIWDPNTGLWTEVAPNAEERLYHSTALLLPDGRVLSAGGGAPGPVTNVTAELYHPSYLVAADGGPTPRLSIESISDSSVDVGDSITLTVDQPAEVQRVTFVKSGSGTHSVDMDQRFLEGDFTVQGDEVVVTLTDNAAAMPPGTYLLSVLDENDIPSVSELVTVTAGSLGPPASPPPAPNRATIGDAVTDVEGEGVEGVKADLFTSNPQGDRLVYLESVESDSQGNYGFDVDAGCYAVTFIAPEGSVFTNGGQYRTLTTCLNPDEANMDLDVVVMDPGQGTATLGDSVEYADGTPAPGVSIDLFASNPDGQRLDYLRTTTTAADGSYEFELSSAGCYAVTFIAPVGENFVNGSGWYTRSTCLADGESDDTVDAILETVIADGATIEGVVSADGVGQPDVKVDLFRANADGSRGPYLRSAFTDEAGAYRFEQLTGCHTMTFIAPAGQTFTNGSAWFNTGVCLQPGEIDNSINPELIDAGR